MANMFVQTCILFAVCAALEISARSVPTYGGDRDEMVCEPRTKFMLDCNTCYCSVDGTRYSCTLMACPPAVRRYFNENSDPIIPAAAIRKRSINVAEKETSQDNSLRKKRDANSYDGADQDYLEDEPIPASVRYELARQQRFQDQQQFIDQQRHAYDQAKQQEELKQQAEEVKKQLEYQKSLDAIQREKDEERDDLDVQNHTRYYKPYTEEEDDFEKQLALDLQKSGFY